MNTVANIFLLICSIVATTYIAGYVYLDVVVGAYIVGMIIALVVLVGLRSLMGLNRFTDLGWELIALTILTLEMLIIGMVKMLQEGGVIGWLG